MQPGRPDIDVVFPLLVGAIAAACFGLGFLVHRRASAGSSRRHLLSWLSRASLVLGGLFLSVLLLEIGARYLLPGGPVHTEPVQADSAGAIVEPLPDGQAYWEYRGAWGFDDRGIRTGRPEPGKPSLRMTVLGDSVTYGIRVDYDQSFPFLLAGRLEPRVGPVALTNLAVPGYSTEQERISLERKGMSPSPDLILLGVFPNDLAQYTVVGSTAYDIRVREVEGVATFELFPLPDGMSRFLTEHSVFYRFLTLRAMAAYDLASGRDETQVAAAMAEMERIRQIAAGASSRLVIVLLPMLGRELSLGEDGLTARFYGQIRSWASNAGILLIDLRPLLAGYDLRALRIDECCHFSPYGHEVVAGLLSEQLGKILAP